MSADLTSFNPFSPQVLQCPYPYYAQMREDAPVLVLPHLRIALVARHDLVTEVLRDVGTYSSRFGSFGATGDSEARARLAEVFAEGYPRTPTLLTTDPPEHTRYRSLVASAFHARAVAEMEPVVREVVQHLISAWSGRSRVEFVAEFAVPLPLRVIAHALNVPEDRLSDFKRWSDDSVAAVGTDLTLEERVQAERGVNELQRYFADQIELRRRQPLDDLLTRLLDARVVDDTVEDSRPLETAEILSIIQQLLVAGNETTTKLLAEMMVLLADRPDEWERLRHDPSRAERIVEEALRLSSPVQGMWRLATADTELGGVAIPKGTRVVALYASANRDERVFPAPDQFDADRERVREHLAFGRGTHFCLGAGLARLEARVTLQALAAALRTYSIADGASLDYSPSFLLRGLTALDLDIEMAGQSR